MKKYLRTIVTFIIFVIFAAAIILTYTSADYVRAREQLTYLNSDMGKFSMEVEEHMNEWYGYNNDSSYREWHAKVERTEEIVKNKQTLCLILGGFSLLSLGGTAIMFVQDRSKARIAVEESQKK